MKDVLFACLIVFALVGAAAIVANLQHAKDRLSPEPYRHVGRFKLLGLYFAGSVIGWACAHRFGLIPPGMVPWLLLWCATWLTVYLAIHQLAKAIHNARARAKALRRYHGFNAAGFNNVWMLLPLLLLGLTGCAGSSGTIRAAAVDSTFRRVAARHDAYVNGDATLPPLAKTIALQDTALLRGVLDEAGKTVTPAAPATQPVK